LLLHFLAYRGGRALFGWSATATYEWTSCIAGGLFVLALWSLAAAALPRTGGRRTLFAFLLSMGTTQLFFGYGENYTLATLASALYAGSALRYLNGDAKLIWPTTCLLLTIGLHLLFLTLAPSWFYLLWKDRGRIGLFLRQSRHLLPLAALCSLTGLWAYNAHYRGQHLPLFQTAEPGFYPIFSLPHLANLSNEVLLLSPFGLLWALAELRRIRTASPQQHFAAWAFLGTASLIGVHYIQMGGRDWDLMAAPGLFYALWGALSLAALDAKRLFPIIRVFIIPITALHTALWIGINHNPQRGLDRLGNLLYHTPNQPVHYQHFTRGHYLLNIRRAGYDQAADAFRQALAHRPANDPQATARYFKFLGTALTQSGHYRQAATSFDSAYAAQSDSLTFAADADFHYYWALACGALAETHRGTPAAQQWWQQAATQARRSVHIEAFYDNNLLLAQTLEALGQFADAIYYYRASLALREDATEALSNLGRAFLRSNRHREAIPVFQQLIKSQPTNQSAHTLIAREHIYLENYAAA
ncbi:MAG: tetratricopeptide repeat protein, partial [Rhodospirillales bacterium]|nr:tetratricopeptide repeat protein [Rhodospirillales bacterium]